MFSAFDVEDNRELVEKSQSPLYSRDNGSVGLVGDGARATGRVGYARRAKLKAKDPGALNARPRSLPLYGRDNGSVGMIGDGARASGKVGAARRAAQAASHLR